MITPIVITLMIILRHDMFVSREGIQCLTTLMIILKHYILISREGIRCLETLPDLDTDTEASDWQGFD